VILNVNTQTGEITETNFSAQESAEQEAFNRDVLPGIQLQNFRAVRNRLLAETDWWANSDVTMTDEQRAYRQALRDLPANTVDPANPVWPVKPGGNS